MECQAGHNSSFCSRIIPVNIIHGVSLSETFLLSGPQGFIKTYPLHSHFIKDVIRCPVNDTENSLYRVPGKRLPQCPHHGDGPRYRCFVIQISIMPGSSCGQLIPMQCKKGFIRRDY